METKGIYWMKDFEARIRDIIEAGNQVAGFPTKGFRYPEAKRELGDMEVSVSRRVENIGGTR
jgi:hypothetical protein